MDRPFQQPQDKLGDPRHPRAAKEMWQDWPQTPRPTLRLAGGSAGQLTCPLPFRSQVCLLSVL